MKRVMTTSTFVAAGLVGALGFASVAWAEATLYGSVRSGVIVQGGDGMDTTWDLGSVDGGDLGSGDRLWSRIGVNYSTELDNGLTAGLKIEKRLDNFRTRHQYVWLEGGFGKVTFGQQGAVYHGAGNADGANYLGGNQRKVPSRLQGIKYSSQLGGPFNFEILIADDNLETKPVKTEKVTHTVTDPGTSGLPMGTALGVTEMTDEPTAYGDGLDVFEVAGTLAAGPVTIKAGYRDGAVEVPNAEDGALGASVSGSAGPISFKVAYETGDLVDNKGDADAYGAHLGFNIGGAGTVYAQYENLDPDAGDTNDYWIFGYSHPLGPGVNVTAEHLRKEEGSKDSDMTVIVLNVSF